MLQIALDIDGVIADFIGHLLDEMACEGAVYHESDITVWSLHASIPKPDHALMERILTRRGFCAGIDRFKNAQIFYKALRRFGRVQAVTQVMPGNASWPQERYEWLISMGFNDEDIHLVRSPEEKLAVPMDVLIEDRLETLQSLPPRVVRVLMDRPWNQQAPELDEAQKIHRCKSYLEVLAIVGSLVP